ncbi:RsmB/NOP family class I SAM-dependent RNA methyltransferase [Cohnella sp. REN36]|uniref:RsmB/NOP family class I SAM-dependent RNA methyltransferase n=1 Tax=Cohnella sp. REN36 TaxID=2887347 RepID=UPI001D13DC91|nr:RsmB/NOP family class I SAM-dependent RNA methyltransferase [Cohnella sp. REN36]MCC3376347.1 RsmB/NOP family class I SAM-dependent RNA methyltransferase [Cohnella sp. REN36]
MRLPERFAEEMAALLRDEAERFFASYEQPKQTGLRVNGLKLSGVDYEARFGRRGAPIPWTEDGRYTTEGDDRPGKHPHYDAGLYYIQEPSAMVPAELLDVRPGHRVLDLCAAPGGKTTQLAAKLRGEGVLVTNDNAAERTKALAKNVERAGIRNAVVTNEEPARLADAFGAFFDRVLVDAPCSGEGMFRKDEDMARLWEPGWPRRYAAMQDAILAEAARMVAPGGRLVYSTCTFSPVENEGTIARFLAAFPDFAVVPIAAPAAWGFAPGRPDWLSAEEAAGLNEPRRASLSGTVRLWPHLCRGEGHFAALLVREGETPEREVPLPASPVVEGRGARPMPVRDAKGTRKAIRGGKRPATVEPETDVLGKFDAFAADALGGWQPPGRLYVRGDYLYALSADIGEGQLHRLKVVRSGWLLGMATKHRFEPSQALAMGLSAGEAARVLLLSADEDAALRYLRGETLQPDPDRVAGRDGRSDTGRGWTLVCVDGYPVGWGRWDGATLKNELLPGWRRV